ncbi:hypothetical protein PG996_001297 [Apiospora saccharicola]|uniref:Uncharacterized protein n=1 Tax=Apiospora saccharicola TaxID=335842 RepID=A0ABR1WG75_9PEZI
MSSPSSRGNDAHHDSRHEPRHWNSYEMQAACALVCKGAHLKGLMSFATKLNMILNKNGKYEDDIDIDDIEELLERIETKKKGALAFIERQGHSRITRTQRRVFERNLGFDGTLFEWEGGRKEKVMQARQDREARQGSLDGGAKEDEFAAADGTRIDRWTPSMYGEIAQTGARVSDKDQTDGRMAEGDSMASQPISMQGNVLLTRDVANRTPGYGKGILDDRCHEVRFTNKEVAGYPPPTPIWGNLNITQPPGWGYIPRPADTSAAWGPRGVVPSQGPTPPWRSAQQPTGSMSNHAGYQHWGPTYESSERK